jgi:hypothetical protein
MNQVIDLFTFSPTSFGTHSDGMVIHDRFGNALSLIHTSNSLFFGSGLFVQGVSLPDALNAHVSFLKGPFNNRAKSIMLRECLQANIATGSDGLPVTITGAIGQLHLITSPLVLLTSGWGRDDVAEIVKGPFAWPAPGSFGVLDYNLFQFLLFTKEENATCNELCGIVAPFRADVVSNLESWILRYVEVATTADIMEEDLTSLGVTGEYGSMILPTILRIKNRNLEGVMEIAGATSVYLNGIADVVPNNG